MIILIGFMGAGKTTVGSHLSTNLGVPHYDSDQQLEATHHAPCGQLLTTWGEPRFRSVEAETITSTIAQHSPSCHTVYSLGGGAVTSQRVRSAVAGHTVVFLHVSLNHITSDPALALNRPLLTAAGLQERFDVRQPLYRSIATITLDARATNPADTAHHIMRQLTTDE